jgi:large subunit ribosomal protein L25
MAEIQTLKAEARERAGTGAARAVRRSGRVPAIVYGGGEPPLSISVPDREIRRELNNARFFGTLYNIELGGETVRVLPYAVQAHPVTGLPLHLDFVRARAGTTVTVDVPVAFLNEETSKGLKRGGVLNVVRREIELHCPVDAIPDHLELDLAEADIGDSLHISAITLPEGVQLTITDRDFTVATIVPPSDLEAEEALEEAREAALEEAREAAPEETGEED